MATTEETTMRGMALSRLTRTLSPVPIGFTDSPFTYFLATDPVWAGETEREKMTNRIASEKDRERFTFDTRDRPSPNARFGWGPCPMSHRGTEYRLHYEYSPKLTFQELCAIQHNSITQCEWYDLFDKEEDRESNTFDSRMTGYKFNADFKVFGRIRGAIYQWQSGGNHSCWNSAVMAFNEIRNFKIEHPRAKLEVTLDWAVGNNERGGVVYHRRNRGADQDLYMDGPLGFCIYHNGAHVLTASFTIIKGAIAICQIQSRVKRGNRLLAGWDYKSAVIDAFRKTFVSFPIWMVTGKSMMEHLYGEFEREINLSKMKISETTSQDTIRYWTDAREYAEKKIEELKLVEARILKFYPATPEKEWDIKAKAKRFEFVELPPK